MPLFLFKCSKCDSVSERFISSVEDKDVLCEKCGEKCEKQISTYSNRTQLDSKSFYNDKILPDVKRISKELDQQKDDVLFDICGEK